jgi:4-aminobutyrate aminotransferase-like enzyme
MPWFTGQPNNVKPVHTKYRKIVTAIPAPGSVEILERLKQYEPRSMGGQPPIVWDRAQGIHVFDRFGNMWMDWSSGVLVTNAGHAHPKIAAAIAEQLNKPLLTNYCFPSEIRSKYVEALAKVSPKSCQKVFLLTTGAEATECAIKLARTHGKSVGGNRKIGIVSCTFGFHGRTMGSQMAGGIPALKEWIVNLDPAMYNVPFPDGFRQKDTRFEVFIDTLKKQGKGPEDVAGVILETYQGGSAAFAPTEYIQQLRKWCDEHKVVLIFDEVQAGFGRTGKMWGFEHYGVDPDLFCCGKGMSSSMPISAVVGRQHLMDQFPPGSMTSTHSGSPLCVAAALANLEIIKEEKLVENAAKLGAILDSELKRLVKKFGGPLGAGDARGLVGTLQIVKPGTTDPDKPTAEDIVRRCVEKGLLMFAPVGVGGACVKISPPLITPEDALREGIAVLEESITETLAAMTAGAAV